MTGNRALPFLRPDATIFGATLLVTFVWPAGTLGKSDNGSEIHNDQQLHLFNGYLLHRSLPNIAKSGYRRVLVNHYMSASSLLPWRVPAAGEQMAIADYRDIVMVAGNDPYAYKGLAYLSVPHVRPSGEGGCDTQVDTEDENLLAPSMM